jgi:hypothetical protein
MGGQGQIVQPHPHPGLPQDPGRAARPLPQSESAAEVAPEVQCQSRGVPGREGDDRLGVAGRS